MGQVIRFQYCPQPPALEKAGSERSERSPRRRVGGRRASEPPPQPVRAYTPDSVSPGPRGGRAYVSRRIAADGETKSKGPKDSERLTRKEIEIGLSSISVELRSGRFGATEGPKAPHFPERWLLAAQLTRGPAAQRLLSGKHEHFRAWMLEQGRADRFLPCFSWQGVAGSTRSRN